MKIKNLCMPGWENLKNKKRVSNQKVCRENMKCTCSACEVCRSVNFWKINIQLFIFHWGTNSILGRRSEKKAQVLVDLSKNTSMTSEVNFLFATRISIGFYHNLLSFISDHRWCIMTFSEWIWINLCKKKRWATF